MIEKLRGEHALVFLPIALALWSISRIWTVLPSLMQDEYIYSSQARNLPFEEQRFSNYIYSWILGATNFCGDDFYSCSKSINAVFFLVTVLFTLLIASRFLTFRWSVFVASVTALSPIAIPVSYFMPETMYFAFMTITIWLTLVVSKSERLWLWVLPGLALGATALVKPHAIFMLPAFALFAFTYCFKFYSSAWLRSLASAAATVVGFLVAKLGLGFAFAGTQGLKLFGGYADPAKAITNVINQSADNSGATEPVASGLQDLLSISSVHLLAHAGLLLLLAGVPLILSLRISLSVVRTKQPIGDASAFFILIALISVSIIAVVSVFESWVTIGGDDHTDRLILRYYEFLIPQFLVMGLLLDRFTDSKRVFRIIQGSVIVIATMAFAVIFPIASRDLFVDSSTLPGLRESQGFFVFIGVILSASVVFWVVKPERGNQAIGRVIIPALLILALILSQSKLIEKNGTPAYFDRAGWDTRSYLQDIPGERILVVGSTRPEVFTVKFWIDDANIKDLLLDQGSIVTPENVAQVDYVISLGSIELDFESETITEGEGYRLVRVSR